ncbi:MAG TPA: hypothetical protein VER17_11925, partial [Tepidisphaeraceae bacterium]|nr:hypothetical protein [Tepidisphaeraceae bacterium]
MNGAFHRWEEARGGRSGGAYAYDALGRRIQHGAGFSTATDLYYSDQWQVLEERQASAVKAQQVWSPVYVDAMIARDRDADASGGNGLEERLYAVHDANYNVTALVSTAGSV